MNVISNEMFLSRSFGTDRSGNPFLFFFKKEKIATDSWTRAPKKQTGEANSF
ncbi:hypothetical protein [Flavobacterium solisilvae]|uniref:Uncharacterized protein n=1 Tax=Flavobacterium solisilvae TaxID=1852019 RepID=A0ABX1QUX0_9FLAO|nr:hypothetical protein [Flavobacterium solisilvae]NMH24594.1 hypothetical protein [Flavobacterium solisilvae]